MVSRRATDRPTTPPPPPSFSHIYSACQFARTGEKSPTCAAGVGGHLRFPESPVFSMPLLPASEPPPARRPYQIVSFIMCCPLGTRLKAVNSFCCVQVSGLLKHFSPVSPLTSHEPNIHSDKMLFITKLR